MRRVLRYIARTLLALLLVTVLAPSFGWEVSAGQVAHGLDVPDLCDAQGAGEVALTAGQDKEGGPNTHQHHGCAAHMLGHLIAMLSDAHNCAVLGTGDAGVPERSLSITTVPPRRLDRPPLASRLA